MPAGAGRAGRGSGGGRAGGAGRSRDPGPAPPDPPAPVTDPSLGVQRAGGAHRGPRTPAPRVTGRRQLPRPAPASSTPRAPHRRR